MKIVEHCLVSDELGTVNFVCDLSACHGACCIEGDAGAPLDEREISILEDNLDQIIPYMTDKGREEVLSNGVFDYDAAGNFVTPLVDGRECAFVYFEGETALCAIEKAWLEKKTDWQKPISCHLYPIRVQKLHDGDGLNYHKWPICKAALKKGRNLDVPLYKFLEQPLTRAYGREWYQKLSDQMEGDKKNQE
jgi:hypothetical protein